MSIFICSGNINSTLHNYQEMYVILVVEREQGFGLWEVDSDSDENAPGLCKCWCFCWAVSESQRGE